MLQEINRYNSYIILYIKTLQIMVKNVKFAPTHLMKIRVEILYTVIPCIEIKTLLAVKLELGPS